MKTANNPNKKQAIRRLNLIIGQLEGLKGMVLEDKYCIDILNQSLAVQNSLKSFDGVVLEGHLQIHSAHQFKKGDPQAVKELLALFKRSNKS